VAVATGRPLALADHTLELIGGADWIACGNGSSLLETSTGVLHRDASLPPEMIESVIVELRHRVPGIGFAIELQWTVIEEVGFARRVPPSPHVEPVTDALAAFERAPGPVRKLIPFHDDYDHRLDDLAAVVSELIDDRCGVYHGGLPLVEIALKGDHKAVALQHLVDHLAIAAGDVIAFGDGRNDIEMLRWAGLGVAMGNAPDDVRNAADHVTDDHDAGGVAVFLEPLLDHLESRR
jgi:hydroxymethylpyrimidine pyrophosphatase-like HAD family hydrolase